MKRKPVTLYIPIEGEIFKAIEGHPNYEISNLGRVKSTARSYRVIIMFTDKDKDGYVTTSLRKGRKKVHRLVAEAFIPNLLNLSQVNHKDGNKENNYPSNLEWVTCRENIHHAMELGLNDQKGEKNHNAKLTVENVLDIRLRLSNKSATVRELMLEYNVKDSQIRFIRDRRCWKHI